MDETGLVTSRVLPEEERDVTFLYYLRDHSQREVTAFLNLSVAEPFTKRPGQVVPRGAMFADVRSLLGGEHDSLPADALYMIGALEGDGRSGSVDRR